MARLPAVRRILDADYPLTCPLAARLTTGTHLSLGYLNRPHNGILTFFCLSAAYRARPFEPRCSELSFRMFQQLNVLSTLRFPESGTV